MVALKGGRIIDNLQIDNLQIDNRQIDNRQIDNLTNLRQIYYLQIDNRQINNLTFSKIDSAISLPCPHGLGNWQHGGEVSHHVRNNTVGASTAAKPV